MITIPLEAYRLSMDELAYIKKLQELFEYNGYYFNRLPEIYYDLSDFCNERQRIIDDEEECDIIYNIDYLGVYVYQYDKEGTITLYRNRIINCAEKIAFEIGISEKAVIEYLRMIVLFHELGHWITHWCHKKKQKARAKSYEKQSVEVKEIMAQLTVVWAIMNNNGSIMNKGVNEVFNALVEKQTKVYKKFRKFGQRFDPVKIIKEYENLIESKDNYNYLLNYSNFTSDIEG